MIGGFLFLTIFISKSKNMAKVVKLKLKDIKNIVENINQSEMEEQQTEVSSDLPIAIGKGEDGKFYVFDTKTGDVLGSL